jgi:hypothetical protein
MLLLFQLKPMKMAILYHVVIQDFITWLGAQLGTTIGISLDLDFVQFEICRCLIQLARTVEKHLQHSGGRIITIICQHLLLLLLLLLLNSHLTMMFSMNIP